MRSCTSILMILFSSCVLVSLSNHVFSSSIGSGRDGSPAISGIVNAYTPLMKDVRKCDDRLLVADASAFKPGDLVLIIQMQGALIKTDDDSTYGNVLDYRHCGNNEYAVLSAVDGKTLILKNALDHDFDVAGRTQVVRVPQYENATVTGPLTCQPWNGLTGGVLAIDVKGTLRMESDLNVSGRGFRGGLAEKGNHVLTVKFEYVAEPDPTYYSLKGEGIAGYGVNNFISGRGAVANGGGGGNIHTTGGGGGSNGSCGGDGGWGYPVNTAGDEKLIFGLGGHVLDYSSGNKLFMGGGGGAGHEHFGNGTSGANGGGIIFMTCDTLDGNGYHLLASGDGSGSSGAYGDGAGGGGGAGTVCIAASMYSSSVSVLCIGGNGGSTILKGFGPGGGGGGGVVYLQQAAQPSQLNIAQSGGIAGLAGGNPYGAKNGCDGLMLFSWMPAMSNIPAVHAGFSMSSLNARTVALQNLSSGADAYRWTFGDGTSDSISDPQHQYSKTGFHRITLVASNGFCADTASNIYISETANVFTPNGDHLNDFFFALDSTENFTVDLSVFNRWGNRVFNNSGTAGWNGNNDNGKELPSGTYYYIATVLNLESRETFTRQGYIMLIR